MPRQTGAPLPRALKPTGFGLAGAGLPCRGCLPRRNSGAGRGRCEGVRHVPQLDAGASSSVSPRTGPGHGAASRRERIERGGHVSGRHDALPRVGDGVWMTSTTPCSHCRNLSGRTQASRCPPSRTVTRCDRQTVTIAGRQARRDVLSPGNRGFPGTFPTPGPASPVGVCSAQAGQAPRGGGWGELPASPTRSP